MPNYKSTIVRDHPEYINKKLLLINKSKTELYRDSSNNYLELEITTDGDLVVNKISPTIQKTRIETSLRKIGMEYLGLHDPTVKQMLKYLVIPEMEVERIFNNLRYKYLKSIYLSEIKEPGRLISAKYNKAFQSYAGINVYQGNTASRKDNKYFWQSAGLKGGFIEHLNFNKEKAELRFIINYIKQINKQDIARAYTELIAIKPGFHELWIHDNYFDKNSYPKDNDLRSQVFRLLRCVGDPQELKLSKMPGDVNNYSNYFSYATCNITEGPFVFRKDLSISYFDEIRNVRTEEKKRNLEKKFHVLDYKHKRLDTREKLKELLIEGERFIGFR